LKIRLEIDLLDTIVGNTRRVMFSDGRTVDVYDLHGEAGSDPQDQVLQVEL
jgi:hypothetical protein